MSRYRPKDNIFKTLCSYAKNYVHEVKNSIKSSKIVKNGPQIVKNKNFQKIFFFCSFYVIMSLHAKNCVCRSNGLACGQYKDKEEKTPKKTLKGPKNVKKWKFRKTEKLLFSLSFYVIMSLHARNCVWRSNGVTSGQYRDKEEKNSEKGEKRP